MESDMRVIDFEEEEYRRGYCDGWMMALREMRHLLREEDRPPEEALARCEQHRKMLKRWFEQDGELLPPAPRSTAGSPILR